MIYYIVFNELKKYIKLIMKIKKIDHFENVSSHK